MTDDDRILGRSELADVYEFIERANRRTLCDIVSSPEQDAHCRGDATAEYWRAGARVIGSGRETFILGTRAARQLRQIAPLEIVAEPALYGRQAFVSHDVDPDAIYIVPTPRPFDATPTPVSFGADERVAFMWAETWHPTRAQLRRQTRWEIREAVLSGRLGLARRRWRA